MLTCAIIDDDEINRLTLEHYVELTPNLKLMASLADGLAGLTFFREGNRVDVLFLDIEMPHLSGLDLLRVLPNHRKSSSRRPGRILPSMPLRCA